MFSNAFLAYIRTLRREDSYEATRLKLLKPNQKFGSDILDTIESMQSLGILRPLPDSPNERSYYYAVHRFAVDVGYLSSGR
jgi:hypothetical protein